MSIGLTYRGQRPYYKKINNNNQRLTDFSVTQSLSEDWDGNNF